MSDNLLSIEMVLRQQKQLLADNTELLDQLTLLTATCMRIEGAVESALGALRIEMQVLRSQYARLAQRVTGLEGGEIE